MGVGNRGASAIPRAWRAADPRNAAMAGLTVYSYLCEVVGDYRFSGLAGFEPLMRPEDVPAMRVRLTRAPCPNYLVQGDSMHRCASAP